MSNYYSQDVKDVTSYLKTDLSQGLSEQEASIRLEEHGENVLIRAKLKNPLQMLLDQFKDFMIGLLLVAALISGFVGEPKDTIAIIVIILLNAAIGFVQEYRAEKAIEELLKLAAPSAQILRNGQLKSLPSTQVIPGDIVMLNAGDVVPADLRLFEAANLSIDESILTGESVPVEKTSKPLEKEHLLAGDQINMAFSSTQVSRGRGAGIAVGTAMNTEVGSIAGLVQAEELKTPLQKRLARFGRTLVFAVIGITAIVFATGVLTGVDPALMFLTAISLAVAAVPEALPAVVTIALALGAKKLVKQNSLIRRLPAVETLGSVTYICSDKTGTLTQNKMKAEELFIDNQVLRITGEGYQPTGQFLDANGKEIEPEKWLSFDTAMHAAALNNDSTIKLQDEKEPLVIGDPTEISLLAMAGKTGYFKESLERELPRVREIAFESERKKMSTIHRLPDGHYVSYTKGAFEVIAPSLKHFFSNGKQQEIRPQDLEHLNNTVNEMSSRGLRVLALTSNNWQEEPPADANLIESDLTLLALVGIIDPPREEVKNAVIEARSAGIHPVMITGDHPETAKAIATKLGIYEPGSIVVTGYELEKMSLEKFEDIVQKVTVYARVAPEHKVKIVKALQDKGQFIAMTGDGINDAPALKSADIGVAMGITGTDVTKEASDMVLLDDNFATIIHAVKEGRRIFDNIRRFIKYSLTSNSGEIWTMFLAPFLGLPVPLLPIHILWINLVTDGLPGLAMAAEPQEADVMKRPPRHPKESIFAHGLWQHAVWVGLLMGGVSLLSQGAFINLYGKEGHWQTAVFSVLALSQMGHAMAIRSETESLFKQGLFSNKPLLGAILLTLILQLVVIYIPILNPIFRTQPLSLIELIFVLFLSALVFIAVEIEKLIKRKG